MEQRTCNLRTGLTSVNMAGERRCMQALFIFYLSILQPIQVQEVTPPVPSLFNETKLVLAVFVRVHECIHERRAHHLVTDGVGISVGISGGGGLGT